MKMLSLVSLLSLAGCMTDENLGDTSDLEDPSAPPEVDGAPYVPDANPPHTFVWWAPRQGVTPDQACNRWALDDTAATDPVLNAADLRLSASSGERMSYAQAGADLTPSIPDSMVVEGIVQLIAGDAGVRFSYHGWAASLTITDGRVTTGSGTTAILSTSDAHHVYRLQVDPWTGWMKVTADEVVIAEESAANIGLGAAEAIEFGQLAPGSSSWVGVAHDVHAITTCPLP